jgi:hypothetical protein
MKRSLPTGRRFALPYRLRMSSITRSSRVTAVQCTSCRQWVKPRYLRVPACICRRCDVAGHTQTWQPTPTHLARANADATRQQAMRNPRVPTSGGTR